VLPFRGHGAINVLEARSSPASVIVPELVRMKELYGEGVTPLLNRSSNTLSIPWSAIRSVRTQEVTSSRYTFIRKDTGEEIESFRPRQVAESLRIELTSAGSLNFDGTRTAFGSDIKEIKIEHLPEDLGNNNAYLEHFHHYLHYALRPSSKQFDVEPRKLYGSSSPRPKIGNSFWIDAEIVCYLIALD
jgi:hypothetical protein